MRPSLHRTPFLSFPWEVQPTPLLGSTILFARDYPRMCACFTDNKTSIWITFIFSGTLTRTRLVTWITKSSSPACVPWVMTCPLWKRVRRIQSFKPSSGLWIPTGRWEWRLKRAVGTLVIKMNYGLLILLTGEPYANHSIALCARRAFLWKDCVTSLQIVCVGGIYSSLTNPNSAQQFSLKWSQTRIASANQ